MFEDWAEDELRTRIRASEEALARGVAKVSFNGESIDYSTPANLRRVIAEMRKALRKKAGFSKPLRILNSNGGSGWSV